MFRRNVPALLGTAILLVIIAVTSYGTFIYGADPYDIVWAPHEPPGVTPRPIFSSPRKASPLLSGPR